MDRKKRVLNILQVAVFLFILAAGTGAVVFGACEGKTYSELEKRELAAFPEVKAGDVFSGKFEGDFDTALSDHFYGRDVFVTAKTWMEILLGKREIDGIFIDGERLIETYKDSDFDDKQIQENISYVTGFMASVAGNIGAEHVKLALVPSKCTVYRDHLPGYMPTSKRADSLAAEMRDSLAEKLVSSGTPEAVSGDEEEEDDAGETSEDSDESVFEDEDSDESVFADEDSDESVFGDEDSDESVFGDEDSDESVFGDEDSDESVFGDEDSDESVFGDEDSGDDGKPSEEDVSEEDGSEDTADGDAPVATEAQIEAMKEKADKMVVDLRPALKQYAAEYIYYLTDHHWTTLGAMYAYQAMMDAAEIPVGGKDDSSDTGESDAGNKTADSALPTDKEAVSEDFLGTDYNRIHYYKNKDVIHRYVIPEADAATMEINDAGDIKKKETIYDKDALQTADKYNYYFSGNFSAITVETGAKNDKTLLIVKDSFSNSLIPFLCRDYGKIILVDLRYVNGSVTDYLPQGEKLDDVWIVCNEEKFMQDTHQMYLQ